MSKAKIGRFNRQSTWCRSLTEYAVLRDFSSMYSESGQRIFEMSTEEVNQWYENVYTRMKDKDKFYGERESAERIQGGAI